MQKGVWRCIHYISIEVQIKECGPERYNVVCALQDQEKGRAKNLIGCIFKSYPGPSYLQNAYLLEASYLKDQSQMGNACPLKPTRSLKNPGLDQTIRNHSYRVEKRDKTPYTCYL